MKNIFRRSVISNFPPICTLNFKGSNLISRNLFFTLQLRNTRTIHCSPNRLLMLINVYTLPYDPFSILFIHASVCVCVFENLSHTLNRKKIASISPSSRIREEKKNSPRFLRSKKRTRRRWQCNLCTLLIVFLQDIVSILLRMCTKKKRRQQLVGLSYYSCAARARIWSVRIDFVIDTPVVLIDATPWFRNFLSAPIKFSTSDLLFFPLPVSVYWTSMTER